MNTNIETGMEDDINYQKVIDDIYKTISKEPNIGQAAAYIPELAKVDIEKFGVCLRTIENNEFGIGDWQTKFSIQSIAKVFSLSMAYKIIGEDIWKRVGVEPSGNAFNSLIQLETDHGIPRNPFINGGALVICDLLISHLNDAPKEFLQFIRKVSTNPDINYSKSVAHSEKSVGYRNIALCHFIKSFGNINNDPNEVLDFYFHMCSIEMSCQELTQAIFFLVDKNYSTNENNSVLNFSQTKRINSIMQSCGFYDESGEFSFRVGLPGKSGVGGGILAVCPEIYSICVWSPRLNEKGNSHRGLNFLEQFTTKTKISIF